MEFRAPAAAAQQYAATIEYLTKNLDDAAAGQRRVEELIAELGNAVYTLPDWHPIWTLPPMPEGRTVSGLSEIPAYNGLDHTEMFVRGFITCPYQEDRADKIVEAVNEVPGLYARRLDEPLYSDQAYPVVVQAMSVELEADGTIKSRDALAWFVQHAVKDARNHQVAETWWSMRSYILGRPHGSRSSLIVNQHAGSHMRKIFETMNESGMFGPIKEWSLDMLSQKKRDAINETLLRAAVESWNKEEGDFTFELRGEMCKAAIRDTWSDNMELSIRVEIGKSDLYISGFYYPAEDRTTYTDPVGKRKLAEKFM